MDPAPARAQPMNGRPIAAKLRSHSLKGEFSRTRRDCGLRSALAFTSDDVGPQTQRHDLSPAVGAKRQVNDFAGLPIDHRLDQILERRNFDPV